MSPPQFGGVAERFAIPWHIQATASVGRGAVVVALPAIIRSPAGKARMTPGSRCDPPR